MSRLNRVPLNSSGLSKQSTKTYKAVRQKSNADLDKTLKQLKIEHKASISRILQEEYALKNVQHSLKTKEIFTGETKMSFASDCTEHEQDSEEAKMEFQPSLKPDADECGNAAKEVVEKPVFISKLDSCRPKYSGDYHKKKPSFHLPSIMEETSRCVLTQTTKKTQPENILPPLFDNNFSKLPRGHSEEQSGRCRSKTISIPDETRESKYRYVMRKRSSVADGRIASNNKRKDLNSLDHDDDSSTPQGWGEEMIGCRYLRRSHSSPNVFDIESFIRK
jgi:hypothetical protein